MNNNEETIASLVIGSWETLTPKALLTALATAAPAGPWEISAAPRGFSNGRSIKMVSTIGISLNFIIFKALNHSYFC